MEREDRPAPAWVGDVSAGVDAWTRGDRGDRGGRRSRRERPPAPPPDRKADGPDADPESVARTILLNALTGQARSRKELRDKLAKKDVPDELAERLLDRFGEVGLVNDEAFARSWVESRQRPTTGATVRLKISTKRSGSSRWA